MQISSQEYQKHFAEFYKQDRDSFRLCMHEVCTGASSPDKKIIDLCKKYLWKEESFPYREGAKLSAYIPKEGMLDFFVARGCEGYACQEQFLPTEKENAIYLRLSALHKENGRLFRQVIDYFQKSPMKEGQIRELTSFLVENELMEQTDRSLVKTEERCPGLKCERYRNTYEYTALPILEKTVVKKKGSLGVIVVHPYKGRVKETFQEIEEEITDLCKKDPKLFQILMSSLYLSMEKISAENKELLYQAKFMVKVSENHEWRAPLELMKLCGYWDWTSKSYKPVEKMKGCDLFSSYQILSKDLDSLCQADKELIRVIGWELFFNKIFTLTESQKRRAVKAKLYENGKWKYPGLMLHCIRHNVWHEQLSVRNPLQYFIAKNLEDKFMRIF